MNDILDETTEPALAAALKRPDDRRFRFRDFSRFFPSRWSLFALLASLLSCAVLFLPRSNPYYKTDWSIHVWMISYISQFLGEHHSLPLSLVNLSHKSMVTPIFYSAILYSILGALGALLRGVNPEIMMKFFVFLTFVMQYMFVAATVRRLFGNRWLALVAASMVTWAVYPLSNVYARGAIPEFISAAILVSAFCVLVQLFISRRNAEKPALIFTFFLLWTIIAGSHPITGVCGSAFLVFILPVLGLSLFSENSLNYLRKPRAYVFLAIACIISLIVLAPWVYATKLFLSSFLTNVVPGTSLVYFNGWSDGWLARLWPFGMMPYYEHFRPLFPDEITPFLEGTINVPLLLLNCWLFAIIFKKLKSWKFRAALLAQALFIFLSFFTLLLISIYPSVTDRILPSRLVIIQYAYRLVTYINLMLLIGVFVFGGLCLKCGLRIKTSLSSTAVLAFLFAFSFAILITKQERSLLFLDRDTDPTVFSPPAKIQDLTLHFPNFYSADDYCASSLFKEPDGSAPISEVPIFFNSGLNDKFGVFQTLAINVPQTYFFKLNVVAHPWNRISIDNKMLAPQNLYHIKGYYCILLKPGIHELAVQTQPDQTYLTLRRIGYSLFAVWLVAIMAYYALTLGSRASGLNWRNLPAPPRWMLFICITTALLLLCAKLFYPIGALCGATLLLSLAMFLGAFAWQIKHKSLNPVLLAKVTALLLFLYGLYFLKF